MKTNALILGCLLIVGLMTSTFSQDMDSREGDSLALLAIMSINGFPYSDDESLLWNKTISIDNWYGISLSGGRIDSLNLGGWGELQLPLEIGNLTKLSYLNLQATIIPEFPLSMSNLTSLKTLISSNCEYTTVPPGLTEIKSLTYLDFFMNKLTTLPLALGNLTNLTYLDLSGNKLTTLPLALGNLTNLTDFRISYNSLTALPPEIKYLTNLTNLSLNNNKLDALPFEVKFLTQLTHFSLDFNFLTSLPPEIGFLTNLIYFGLSENELTGLPLDFKKLTKLSPIDGLDLSRNYLTSSKIPTEVLPIINVADPDWAAKQKDPLPVKSVYNSASPKTGHMAVSVTGAGLNFTRALTTTASIEIYTLSGKLITRSALAKGANSLRIDLPSGMFLWSVCENGVVSTGKVSVK